MLEIRKHPFRFILFVFAFQQSDVLFHNAPQEIVVVGCNLLIANGFLSFLEATLSDAEVFFCICIVPRLLFGSRSVPIHIGPLGV